MLEPPTPVRYSTAGEHAILLQYTHLCSTCFGSWLRIGTHTPVPFTYGVASVSRTLASIDYGSCRIATLSVLNVFKKGKMEGPRGATSRGATAPWSGQIITSFHTYRIVSAAPAAVTFIRLKIRIVCISMWETSVRMWHNSKSCIIDRGKTSRRESIVHICTQ